MAYGLKACSCHPLKFHIPVWEVLERGLQGECEFLSALHLCDFWIKFITEGVNILFENIK